MKGTASTVMRGIPRNAVHFGTYVFMKRLSCKLEGRTKASTFGTLVAGGCAVVGNWIVAIPMEIIKSRWQTVTAGKYKNLLHVFQTMLQETMLWAWFRPRVVASIPKS